MLVNRSGSLSKFVICLTQQAHEHCRTKSRSCNKSCERRRKRFGTFLKTLTVIRFSSARCDCTKSDKILSPCASGASLFYIPILFTRETWAAGVARFGHVRQVHPELARVRRRERVHPLRRALLTASVPPSPPAIFFTSNTPGVVPSHTPLARAARAEARRQRRPRESRDWCAQGHHAVNVARTPRHQLRVLRFVIAQCTSSPSSRATRRCLGRTSSRRESLNSVHVPTQHSKLPPPPLLHVACFGLTQTSARTCLRPVLPARFGDRG